MSPPSPPELRTNATVLPSGDTAGLKSPSDPSGGVVTRVTALLSIATSDSDGSGWLVSTTISDLPSLVQDTAGNGCDSSPEAGKSTTLCSSPPPALTTIYCPRPSARRRNANCFPSGDQAAL